MLRLRDAVTVIASRPKGNANVASALKTTEPRILEAAKAGRSSAARRSLYRVKRRSPLAEISKEAICMGLCRRGDLNPHGTKYRQILSLLRMPISPLRLRVQL